MKDHAARGILVALGVISVAVAGFAIPASAHTTTTKSSTCACSTTTATTSPPSTTTTTEKTTTTVEATSTTAESTTTIILVPPVTATAPPGRVVGQGDTTTSSIEKAGASETLPHTGSSPFFPITFGIGCVIAGVVFTVRRKPREWTR